MPSAFFHHLFGEAARALQVSAGSRAAYAARDMAPPGSRDALTEREHAFLAARDSIYVASVSTDGWPYIQHRGGPPGFVKSLGGNLLGLADYPGNRQFISLGNIAERRRVAVFCMDYAARRRLKLIGHAWIVTADEDAGLVNRVTDSGAPPAERALLIDVVGFDWNCPKYIEQRFTRAEIARELGPLREENARLRAEVVRLQEEAARARG